MCHDLYDSADCVRAEERGEKDLMFPDLCGLEDVEILDLSFFSGMEKLDRPPAMDLVEQ